MPSRLLVAGNNRGGGTTVGWQREIDTVAFVGGGHRRSVVVPAAPGRNG
jgi:hypothetical protein